MEDRQEFNYIKKIEKVTDLIIQNGREPHVLSELQQELHKYQIGDKDPFNIYAEHPYDTETIENALKHLNQVLMTVEMLLLRSWNTFRADKFRFIFSSTLNIIRWHLLKEEYDKVIYNCKHVNIYRRCFK